MKRTRRKMIFFWILGIIFLFFLVSSCIGWRLSAPAYQGAASDNFDGNKFINPDGVRSKGLFDLIKWMMTRDQGEWPEITNAPIGPPPQEKLPDDQIRITFINHATTLIQMNGLNILTDPIWSKRASPFQWIGPKRMRPAGINFADLPTIHLVLISHNHYDHLDEATVKELEKGHSPFFLVPLGVGKFLQKKGVSKVMELDWEQSVEAFPGLNIVAVPAIHFSGRGTLDRDATLWCGYVIKGVAGNVYFAGDTGYGTIFKGIGEKYGPFRVSLIPIGAYKPEWFMSPIHVSPAEAVKIHRDASSQKSIAMHFNTFPLADEGMGDAEKDLKKAIADHSLEPGEFIILQEGTYIDITSIE
jgi:L-ascorbate metabolism protein UlaG (beta-lactamase superfamily)